MSSAASGAPELPCTIVPGCYRELGRERLGHPAMGEARADGRADAAVDLRACDAMRAAERFEAAGKILVGPQPQREGAACRARAGAHSRAPARTA